MNKFICILLTMTLYVQSIFANTLKIVNGTSGQATITIVTSEDTVSQGALPNENQFINDINNQQPTSTTMSYSNNPIDSITIMRTNTNMPQIIYYNNEKTSTAASNSISGIYACNMKGQGVMKILQDKIMLEGKTYKLHDLHSCIVRCKNLQKNLSTDTINATAQQIKDISANLQLIKNSQEAERVNVQTMMLQLAIDGVNHGIATMQALQKLLENVQNLQNHLNDDTAENADRMLQGMQIGLQTLTTEQNLQSSEQEMKSITDATLPKILQNQVAQINNAINRLKLAIQDKKRYEHSINPEELIAKEEELRNEINVNNMQASNITGMGYTPTNP